MFAFIKKNIFITSIIFFSFMLAVLPLEKLNYEYEWQPNNKDFQLYLPLVEKVPETLNIQIPCNQIDFQSYDWILEARGGAAFQIYKNKDLVGVLIGDKKRILTQNFEIKKINSLNCQFEFKYEKEKQRLLIKQDKEETIIKLDPDYQIEIANSIIVNPKFTFEKIKLKITTSSLSDVRESKLRKIIKIYLIICLAYLIYKLRKDLLKKKFIKHLNLLKDPYLSLSFGILLIFNILLPHNIDDGWRIVESKLLKETGIYNNYIVPSSLPTGRVLAYLNSILLSFDNLFAYRLISIFLLLSIWVTSYFTILKHFKDKFTPTTIKKIISFIVIIFGASFLIGLRGEIYVASLLSASFFLISYEEKLTKLNVSSGLLLLSGIGLSIHQSGISIFILYLTYLLINFKKIFNRDTPNSQFFKISIIVFSLFIFYFNNIYSIITNSILYQNRFDEVKLFGDVSQLSPLSEIQRILNIYNYRNGLFTFTALSVITSFFYLIYFNLRSSLKLDFNNIFIYYLVPITSLFLMPSKWAWYYMVFISIVIYAYFFFLYQTNSYKLNKPKLFLYLFLGLFSISTQKLEYNLLPVVNINLNIYYKIFEYLLNVYFWIILLIIILMLTLVNKLQKRIINPLNLSSLYLFSILFILISYKISPVILDSLQKEKWSYLKQNFPIKNQYSCGLFFKNEFKENTVIDSLDNYAYFPCFEPLYFRKGVWDYPKIIIKNFNILDQQRLFFATDLYPVSCFTNYSSDYNEICIYKTKELPLNFLKIRTVVSNQYW